MGVYFCASGGRADGRAGRVSIDLGSCETRRAMRRLGDSARSPILSILPILPILPLLVVVIGSCAELGCSKPDGAPTPGSATSASPSPTPSVTAAPAKPAVASPTLPNANACAFTQAAVSKALGSAYGAGRALPDIPGVPTSSCAYEGKGSQLRVNATAFTPALAAAMRRDLGQGLAGKVSPLAGDADGAVFQQQTGDLATCALHYLRGDVKYEVRLMTCREPEAAARAKLGALPRP